jgi:hypothetical protein
MLPGIRTGATVEGFSVDTDERRSITSAHRRLFAAALVMLGLTGVWTATASFGEPDQKVQKSGAASSASTEDKSEQLKQNQVSLKRSRVYTFVGKTGLGHQHGIEGQLKSGSIQLGAKQDAGELVFDMAGFDADTDAARRYLGLEGSTDSSTREQVNANMKNSSILNVTEYPTATFSVKSAMLLEEKSRSGKARYELVGDFTLRGKTRPLKFVAEAEPKGGMHHVRGQFSILQTEYGIKPFRKALGAVGVTDKLTIHGDLWVASEDAAAAKTESR